MICGASPTCLRRARDLSGDRRRKGASGREGESRVFTQPAPVSLPASLAGRLGGKNRAPAPDGTDHRSRSSAPRTDADGGTVSAGAAAPDGSRSGRDDHRPRSPPARSRPTRYRHHCGAAVRGRSGRGAPPTPGRAGEVGAAPSAQRNDRLLTCCRESSGERKNFCKRFRSVSASEVSHSHTTRTFHPRRRRAAAVFRSRATLASNFDCQNRWRVLGVVERPHPACRCQKQPCTSTIFLSRGKTRSGVPGRSRRWRRKRYPNACESRRTNRSGFVFFPRTRAIRAERSGSGGRSYSVSRSLRFRDRRRMSHK